jgi:hypothetical protein
VRSAWSSHIDDRVFYVTYKGGAFHHQIQRFELVNGTWTPE